MEPGIKTPEEAIKTSLSVTLMVDKVQPSNNGASGSKEDNDGNNEAIKMINNTQKQQQHIHYSTLK